MAFGTTGFGHCNFGHSCTSNGFGNGPYATFPYTPGFVHGEQTGFVTAVNRFLDLTTEQRYLLSRQKGLALHYEYHLVDSSTVAGITSFWQEAAGRRFFVVDHRTGATTLARFAGTTMDHARGPAMVRNVALDFVAEVAGGGIVGTAAASDTIAPCPIDGGGGANGSPIGPGTGNEPQDLGEIVAGGVFTANEALTCNPYYIDVTGVSDWQQVPVNAEFPAEGIEANNGVAATWAVRYGAIQYPGSPTTSDSDVGNHAIFMGRAQLRLVVDGTPQTEFTMLFDTGEVGTTKFATSALSLATGSTLSVEVRRQDAGGADFTVPDSISVKDYFRNMSFQWTLHVQHDAYILFRSI